MQLEKTLDHFRDCRQELEHNTNIQKEKQKQVLLNSQVIKKEVFDIADTMDVMAQVIHAQDDRMMAIEDGIAMTRQAFTIKNQQVPLINAE